MLIRYCGGRSRYKIALNRKPYYFTPENNRTLDIKDKTVRDYIFSLSNRGEFETVESETPVEVKAENKKIEEPKPKKSNSQKGGK